MGRPGDAEDEAAFWASVAWEGCAEDACWAWTGERFADGAGRATYRGKLWAAHRLAWVFVHRWIPPDRGVRHLCGTRHCCNPQHLVLDVRGPQFFPQGRPRWGGAATQQ